jgi:UDP-glucose-4-epimerase GalE
MKTILLTGAAGYLGSEAFTALADAGYRVAATDLREPKFEIPSPATFTRLDLIEDDAVAGFILDVQPDAVVHLAGLLSARESMVMPERYFRVNIVGSLNLIEAMLQTSCRRMIFASTNSVYGAPLKSPLVEDDPLLPHTPYGESKVAVERMLRWFHELKGLSFVALRFFNLAGGDEHARLESSWSGALSTRLLAAALGRIPRVEVFGLDHPTPDGSCVRDFLHVQDAARAVLAALETGAVGTFNISGGRPVSVLEAIEAFRSVSGHTFKFQDRGRRDGDVSEIIADISKAKRELGWEPQQSSIQAIAASAYRSAHIAS